MEMQPNDLGGSNMFKLKDLFEKSPFVSMVEHIEKVSLCLDELEVLLQAVKKKDYATVDKITKTISNYEAEADSIKEEVRKILGGNFYIPFDKNEIMAIVSAQDGVANISKDIAKLFTLRNMVIPKEVEADYDNFSKVVLSVARKGVETVKHISNLFEVGFKGYEVEKVIMIIKELEEAEELADEEGMAFTRKILTLEGSESPVAIYMWLRIIKVMGDLANISEKLSNKFRLLLN